MLVHNAIGEFSDAQAITAAAACTNTLDVEVLNNRLGVGGEMWLCIRTNTAPTDNGDTISIELQCDSTVAFGSARTVLMISNAAGAEITVTDARFATAGAWIYRGTLPMECNERHVRLYYNNTTSNGTITLDAWISNGPPPSDRAQVWATNVGTP